MPTSSRAAILTIAKLIACIALLVLAEAPAARAQQTAQAHRIGYLSLLSRSDPALGPLRDALRHGLSDHGYVEGQNLIIEWRFADGNVERLPKLAGELIGLNVQLIFTETTPAARAAKQATTTIPIVFNPIADPVGEGLVVSLGRPNGNATGLTQMAPELDGKRLALLKEALPALTRVGILSHPGVPSARTVRTMLEETEAAARVAGIGVRRLEAHGPNDLNRPFAALSRERIGALIVLASPMFLSEGRRIVALLASHHLPGMFFSREFVEAGGFISYGPNLPELWRRAARYVDRILKGAKPSELPVEQPTRFEMVVNLKTARTLGLTIPQSMLLRADEIIQ